MMLKNKFLEALALFKRFATKKKGTLWSYRNVTDILHARSLCPITKTLHKTVAAMEKLTVKVENNTQ